MNKTKIEWCDYTWNVYTGCLNTCSYCYGRKISMRFMGHFNPTFHPERLNQPLKIKKPARIFVGSMGEIGYQSKENIGKVIEVCKQCPQHTFLFLSNWQNQDYILDTFPDNCWLGVTITSGDLYDYGFKMDDTLMRKKFISFEPLQGRIKNLEYIKNWDWIIIGGETRNGRLVKEHAPKIEWVAEIVNYCREYRIPVFLKNNLKEIWKDKLIQQIPVK